MINSNLNAFVDIIYYGGELFFLYRGKKFFLQGWSENSYQKLVLDYVEDESDEKNVTCPHMYVWETKNELMSQCAEKFLDAKLWDGRNFWQAEHEMEWVDC